MSFGFRDDGLRTGFQAALQRADGARLGRPWLPFERQSPRPPRAAPALLSAGARPRMSSAPMQSSASRRAGWSGP